MTTDSEPTDARPTRRWQFNLWTLAELVAGCGLASAFFAELAWGSVCIIVPAILIVAVCGYLGTSKNPMGALGRIFAAGVVGLALLCVASTILPRIVIGPGVIPALNCRGELRRLAIALRHITKNTARFRPLSSTMPPASQCTVGGR